MDAVDECRRHIEVRLTKPRERRLKIEQSLLMGRRSPASATAPRCATRTSSPTSSRNCRTDEPMTESIFLADGRRRPGRERYMPTEHARGPWDPRALHGGAPAALMTAAFERMEPGSELPIARLGFEFLRAPPMGPLSLGPR